MKRLQYSLLAAAGILILAFVLTAVGPKRVMAALGFTPVRDVDQAARQPFSATANLAIAASTGTFVSLEEALLEPAAWILSVWGPPVATVVVKTVRRHERAAAYRSSGLVVRRIPSR